MAFFDSVSQLSGLKYGEKVLVSSVNSQMAPNSSTHIGPRQRLIFCSVVSGASYMSVFSKSKR